MCILVHCLRFRWRGSGCCSYSGPIRVGFHLIYQFRKHFFRLPIDFGKVGVEAAVYH